MNLLIALRVDLKASVERTTVELKVARILELEDFEQRFEAKKKRSQKISSITEKVKVHHLKSQEDLEVARCLVVNIEWALAIGASRTEGNVAEDHA